MTLDELNIHKVWLRLDDKGHCVEADALAKLNAAITPGIERVVVISHGWKTNIEDAAGQYAPLWSRVIEHRPATMSDTLLVCLNWPSKTYDPKFINNLSQAQINALSADPADEAEDLSEAELQAQIREAASLLGIGRAKLKAAVAQAVESDKAEDLFRLVSAKVLNGADSEVEAGTVPPDLGEFELRAAYKKLKTAPPPPDDIDEGPAAGLGDIAKKLIEGPRNAAAWVLNQATYYQMKKRAGMVGAALSKAFAGLVLPRSLELHLIGHSFGGRLVTAFADAWTKRADLPLKSVTLLQAAFSHYGLSADKKGVFAGALNKVEGPFVITHTHNDGANYYAYFYASLVSGVTASAAGDNILGGNADSPFGAMGANGAQKSGAVATSVAFLDLAAAKVHNIRADAFIGDHMDIGRSETGQLVAKVIG